MTWLDAIRQREQAATEGPWTWETEGLLVHPRSHELTTDPSRIVVHGPVLAVSDEWFDTRPDEPDAAFIAHARADLPMLLAVVDAAIEAVKGGAHDGDCDNDVGWDSCSLHCEASDARRFALEAALAPLLEPEP